MLPSSRPSLGLPGFISANNTFKAFEAQIRNISSQAQGAALWIVPAGLFASWMVYPALTDSFRSGLGLPKSKEYLPSKVNYMLEDGEIDKMPVKK